MPLAKNSTLQEGQWSLLAPAACFHCSGVLGVTRGVGLAGKQRGGGWWWRQAAEQSDKKLCLLLPHLAKSSAFFLCWGGSRKHSCLSPLASGLGGKQRCLGESGRFFQWKKPADMMSHMEVTSLPGMPGDIMFNFAPGSGAILYLPLLWNTATVSFVAAGTCILIAASYLASTFRKMCYTTKKLYELWIQFHSQVLMYHFRLWRNDPQTIFIAVVLLILITLHQDKEIVNFPTRCANGWILGRGIMKLVNCEGICLHY